MTRIFDPQSTAVVSRAFTFAGKVYERGEVFPWRKLATSPDGKPCPISEFDLRGLWAAELVDFTRDPQRKRNEA